MDNQNLVGYVLAFLKESHLDNTHICVGLSGGLDSIVLLHTLAKCHRALQSFQLSAVHIDHGISEQSSIWSAFSHQYAQTLGVPCTVHPVSIKRQGGESLEAIARHARYAIYQQSSCDVIALAHHQDDQAETVLLQLLRGSGVRGLSAMPPIRRLSINQLLIRPFLAIPRRVLYNYAQQHQLSWIKDPSNEDTRYHRNFIRHEILPRLDKRYSHISQTLARAAQYFSETTGLLANLASIDYPALASANNLPFADLLTLSASRQRNVLYWYLHLRHVSPNEKRLIQMQQFIQNLDKTTETSFSLHNKDICLGQGRLVIVPTFTPPTESISLQWQGEPTISVPAWRGSLQFLEISNAHKTFPIGIIELDQLQSAPIILKPRQGGERLKYGTIRPSQSVKKQWQANKVPVWQRERLPFIWHKDKLLIAPGAGSSAIEGASPYTKKIQITWCPWDFVLSS